MSRITLSFTITIYVFILFKEFLPRLSGTIANLTHLKHLLCVLPSSEEELNATQSLLDCTLPSNI